MSALIVRQGDRFGIVAFVDQRDDVQIGLVCGAPQSAAAVVVPSPYFEPPLPHRDDEEDPGMEPDARPAPPKERWHVMLADALGATGAKGFFELSVDTTLLPVDQLTFRLPDFVAQAFAYSGEGYTGIQIQAQDAERWGAFVAVPAW